MTRPLRSWVDAVQHGATVAVRVAATRALGRRRAAAAAAVPALVAAATADPACDVRLGAVVALGRIGPAAASAAAALLRLVQAIDGRRRVLRAGLGRARRACADATQPWGVGAPARVEAVAQAERALFLHCLVDGTLAAEVWDTLKEMGAAAVAPLAALLRDPDPQVRALAAEALGHVSPHGGEALPALEGALADPAAVVRRAAAEALWELGPSALVARGRR
jgi:HEAT repeat protein